MILDKFFELFRNKNTSQNALCAPFRSLELSDFEPDCRSFHELFSVEMESWVFIDSVGLDIRNGRAYFLHSEVRHVSGAYGSNDIYRPISYDQVRDYAKRVNQEAFFQSLSEETWREFVPDAKIEAYNKTRAPKPVVLKNAPRVKKPITEFFMEVHNLHAHHITWFRQTSQGFRVFSIASHGWNYGLGFRFLATEEMINQIMNGDHGYSFSAYDRLLADNEANALQALAAEVPAKESPLPSYTSGYYICNGIRNTCTTTRWSRFASTLDNIAEHGCQAERKGL